MWTSRGRAATETAAATAQPARRRRARTAARDVHSLAIFRYPNSERRHVAVAERAAALKKRGMKAVSRLEHPAVKRVQAALADAGSGARVIELDASARTAQEAADSLGVPLGAIVKSLVFGIDGDPVMALVAGDRRCDPEGLRRALGRGGVVTRADADLVRRTTGFVIGGVAPVGHPAPLPTVIDDSLGRFDTVYAAAGHPHCVFATTVWELAMLTGAPVVRGLAVD